LDDGADLLDELGGAPRRAVVVGGGYIGIEMAEAFVERQARVTLVESGPHVLRSLDPDMAGRVEEAIRRFGIDLRTGVEVTAIDDDGVQTAAGALRADVVVMGLGVVPNSELAAAAGIETGVRGAVRVDRRQRTSHEAVWAAGDCCESHHLVSGQPVHIALGTVANKQARVAGINIGGGYATFPGVLGTAVTKLCGTEVARTGLTEAEAAAAGFEVVTSTIESTTRSGYFPGARPVTAKLLAERGSGRLLGGQLVGGDGTAKRIDVVAVALQAGFGAQDLVDADLAYAPPFGPLWDPVATAARQLLRRL
jgi:NADPH-dependent 2,4-dienoyl-CoA reductase/sulfur reductase-like enzyme